MNQSGKLELLQIRGTAFESVTQHLQVLISHVNVQTKNLQGLQRHLWAKWAFTRNVCTLEGNRVLIKIFEGLVQVKFIGAFKKKKYWARVDFKDYKDIRWNLLGRIKLEYDMPRVGSGVTYRVKSRSQFPC